MFRTPNSFIGLSRFKLTSFVGLVVMELSHQKNSCLKFQCCSNCLLGMRKSHHDDEINISSERSRVWRPHHKAGCNITREDFTALHRCKSFLFVRQRRWCSGYKVINVSVHSLTRRYHSLQKNTSQQKLNKFQWLVWWRRWCWTSGAVWFRVTPAPRKASVMMDLCFQVWRCGPTT